MRASQPADVAGGGGVVVHRVTERQQDRHRVQAASVVAYRACRRVDADQRFALLGQLAEDGGHVAAQLHGLQVVVVDVRGQAVDGHDGARRIGVPQFEVVRDGVEADDHQRFGVGDDDVTGLVAKEPRPR
ncbi:hypothetical protein ACFWVC_28915 [Streptomyces sp. NPDC058691]|uniref:hypothetical protein n=1 Tax=Streptomyces sp. NPDC058691 TaxID=3346601 RepID=UPI0036587E2C